jgi:hypothetical protein
VESMTLMRDLEFILSEAKESRDRAVLERGYDCPPTERPTIAQQIFVCAE